ncbi:MAG: fumarate hydratase [Christensenellales bacterium]|jgi:fumarate hydratase subunit alpha
MRIISENQISELVRSLFLRCAYCVTPDVERAVRSALDAEESPAGKAALAQILENHRIAKEQRLPICQDTGMAVIFAKVGCEAVIDGDFNAAANRGVRKAYAEGFLRKSVVTDPLYERRNTMDNTPAILHVELVPGDGIELFVTAKGFGSENMSAIRMLSPGEGERGVVDFVVETVKKAGPNPCPPVIVGVGIGGTMEYAALLAKKAALRELGSHNEDPRYAALEEELLQRINRLGIGPAGIGGRNTALGVNVLFAPTHIAGLPVAVNICCHAARHARGSI